MWNSDICQSDECTQHRESVHYWKLLRLYLPIVVLMTKMACGKYFGIPGDFPESISFAGEFPMTLQFDIRVAPNRMFLLVDSWFTEEITYGLAFYFLIGVCEIPPVARGSVGIWQHGRYLLCRDSVIVITYCAKAFCNGPFYCLLNYYCPALTITIVWYIQLAIVLWPRTVGIYIH